MADSDRFSMERDSVERNLMEKSGGADDRADITRNEEATRFLTQEEIEELERFAFDPDAGRGGEEKAERGGQTPQAEGAPANKESRIKIEEIKPKKEPKRRTIKMPAFAPAGRTKFSARRVGLKDRMKKFFRRVLFIACFIAAAVLGFYLAFTWNTQKESMDNAQEYNVRQLENQKASLEEERKSLEEERARIEAQKAELDAQHEELTREKSFLTQIIDTVTGKDQEDKEKAEAVKGEIDKAQTAIEDIGTKLDSLDKMKDQVDDLKAAAQEKINENRDVVRTIQHQIKLLLNNFL